MLSHMYPMANRVLPLGSSGQCLSTDTHTNSFPTKGRQNPTILGSKAGSADVEWCLPDIPEPLRSQKLWTCQNSQKLRLPAQDVSKVKTGTRARRGMEQGARQHGGGVHEAPPAAEELLTADGCFRKESHLSLRAWPGYVNFALAGGPPLMSLCNTNWTWARMKRK